MVIIAKSISSELNKNNKNHLSVLTNVIDYAIIQSLDVIDYFLIYIWKGRNKMKTKKIAALAFSAVLAFSFLVSGCNNGSGENTGTGTNKPSGTGTMRDMTSMELVKEMKIGWNLGDTLDVCQADRDGDGKVNEHVEEGEEVDETLWGNVMTTPELFDKLKEDGVNAVRIPVTWRDHLDDDDNIKESWMNRVQEVVDYAVERDFYVIINMHHDGGGDPKFGAWVIENAQSDYDKFYARYSKMWKQIAERFKNYSDHLIFESLNEVGFDKIKNSQGEEEAFALLNRINQDFVDIIRESGGNNQKRHLLIAGYWTDVAETCKPYYKMPQDKTENRLIVSVHYYTPYEFCIVGSQKTWGSDSDIKLMTDKMNLMKKHFVDKGYPVIIGEYSGGGSNKEFIYFSEYLTKLCNDMGAACFLWDNGGNLNRKTLKWSVDGLMEALRKATSGEDYEVKKGA